jgi:hypothetical protein
VLCDWVSYLYLILSYLAYLQAELAHQIDLASLSHSHPQQSFVHHQTSRKFIDTHSWVFGTARNSFQDSCFPYICSSNDKNPESAELSMKFQITGAHHIVMKVDEVLAMAVRLVIS